MSGHSKWSQIKRQKQSTDIKRGQIFSKLVRAIAVAVREGGSRDPESNFKLRYAIETARSYNMPKENIARAIEQGKGGAASLKLEELILEGLGPAQVSIIVEALTDNRKRTISEVKKIFEKVGGAIVQAGGVIWNFEKKGLVTLRKNGLSEEEILTKAADAGADDIEVGDNYVEVYSQPEKLADLKTKLTQLGLSVESAELTMKPKNVVKVENPEKARQVLNLVDVLDNLDDVQKVYSNFDIPDELLK